MPFNIIRQDLVKMHVDAIVNPSNSALVRGGGVSGAIFKAAGVQKLTRACEPLAPIHLGEAVMTPGFKLPAKYIIHTAGPVYTGNTPAESLLLRACYANSLALAREHDCRSIAFPLISTGKYRFPKKEALRIATSAILDFLMETEMEVYLAVFDKESFSVSEELLGEVDSYIDEMYVDLSVQRDRFRNLSSLGEQLILESPRLEPVPRKRSLEDLVGRLDEPFSTTLLRLIDKKGKTDVEVYKKANIDRKLFSKIRTSEGYMPSKRTALALAIALELSLEETEDLLERAGYALSHSQKFDVIVEYFILHGKYDIFQINEVLFKYDQPLLGS